MIYVLTIFMGCKIVIFFNDLIEKFNFNKVKKIIIFTVMR